MQLWEILAIGLSLSMDATAVTLCNSMACPNTGRAMLFAMPFSFGVFQGIMPILGYLAGSVFSEFITRYAGIIALVILGFIGANMIKGAFESDPKKRSDRLTLWPLMLQSLATSIDAFAVGVSFVALNANVWTAAPVIALTTFFCSLAALLLGKKLGERFGKRAELAGGVVLILIGIKSALGI